MKCPTALSRLQSFYLNDMFYSLNHWPFITDLGRNTLGKSRLQITVYTSVAVQNENSDVHVSLSPQPYLRNLSDIEVTCCVRYVKDKVYCLQHDAFLRFFAPSEVTLIGDVLYSSAGAGLSALPYGGGKPR